MRTIHKTYFDKDYVPFPQRFSAFPSHVSPSAHEASLRGSQIQLQSTFFSFFFSLFGDTICMDNQVTASLWQQRQQSWEGRQQEQVAGVEELQEARGTPLD